MTSPLIVHLVELDGVTTRTVDAILLDVARAAIIRCNGNRSEAARQLGVGRSTFYRWLPTERRDSVPATSRPT